MDPVAGDNSGPVESELADTVRYLDLYLRQKTDLFLQHYVFEPFEILGTKVMYLSVVVALLAAGTLIVVAGLVLFLATMMPLWAALLVTGAVALGTGGAIALVFFRRKIVLQTPTALEMMNRGKTQGDH